MYYLIKSFLIEIMPTSIFLYGLHKPRRHNINYDESTTSLLLD